MTRPPGLRVRKVSARGVSSSLTCSKVLNEIAMSNVPVSSGNGLVMSHTCVGEMDGSMLREVSLYVPRISFA